MTRHRHGLLVLLCVGILVGCGHSARQPTSQPVPTTAGQSSAVPSTSLAGQHLAEEYRKQYRR